MRNKVMAKQRILVCPICGETQQETSTCRACNTELDARGLLFAEASFGPWWIRDEQFPFQPGMTYDHIADLARKGEIQRHTLLRGPTTRQLWTVARHVPGIAHLLGRCHKCDSHVLPSSRACDACQTPFLIYRDRNNLGLENSDPAKGEVDGLSSFLTDTSILDTTSLPLRKQRPHKPEETHSGERVGSPEFSSLQRSLEQSIRTNKKLIVTLILSLIGLAISVLLLVNQ